MPWNGVVSSRALIPCESLCLSILVATPVGADSSLQHWVYRGQSDGFMLRVLVASSALRDTSGSAAWESYMALVHQTDSGRCEALSLSLIHI